MKKVFIFLFIMCSCRVYSQAVVSVGIVDDNLIDIPGLPLDTLFGGADDRYTYSLFTVYTEKNWEMLLDYRSITYRADDIRYDCISLVYVHDFNYRNFSFSLGGGAEAVGDFYSDVFQNSLHRLADFPEVNLQYLKYGVGLIFFVDAGINYLRLFSDKLLFYAETELEINTTISPHVLTVGLPVRIKNDIFAAEIYPGINMKYSGANKWLSGNSVFYRTVFGIRLPADLYLNIGTSRNFFFYNPFGDGFTQYDWSTQEFNENLPILEIPSFYFCIGFGDDSVKLRNIPLP